MASLLGADKLLDKMYPSGFMTLVDYVAKVTRVDLLSSLKRLDEEKVCDRACAGEIEGIFVATTSADIELAFGDVDSLPNAFSLENHSTLKELVMHALSCLCHKANRSNEMYQQRNVLSLGYGLRSNPDNANVVDAPDLQNFYPNTLVNVLQTPLWERVLTCIGDELMLHLLINCSIFIKLDNGCYMQVSGPPAPTVAKSSLPSASMSETNEYRGRVTMRTILPRSSIFYVQSFPRHPGLPKSHFCKRRHASASNNVISSINSARALAFAIFSSNDSHKSVRVGKARKCLRRLPKNLLQIVPLVRSLIINHLNCDYSRLLSRSCPIDRAALRKKSEEIHRGGDIKLQCRDGDECAGRSSESRPSTVSSLSESDLKEEIQRLTVMCSSHNEVCSYVWSICHELVPPALWGSKQNENAFRANLHRFVKCGRHDALTMADMLQHVKTRDMGSWLRDSRHSQHVSSEERQKMMQKLIRFIHFVFLKIVIPLIRHDFYVTEVESSFNRVVYYRRPVWACIERVALEVMKRSKVLQKLSLKESKSYKLSGRVIVPLRFVPKKHTVRPIMNMSKRQIFGGSQSRTTRASSSVNLRLSNTYKALKYEADRFPLALGASVYGADGIFKKLTPFLKRFVHEKPLYFLAMDVMTCYDSIAQEKCFDIVKHVLREDEYVFQKYASMHPEPANRSTRTKFVKSARALGEEEQFLKLAQSMSKTKRNSVFTDGVTYTSDSKTNLIENLRDHIFENTVQVGPGRTFLQTHGIPQGSVLSSLMCNLYYGHMECSKCPHLLLPLSEQEERQKRRPAMGESVLLRLIDDYLLVTTSRPIAEGFAAMMHRGVAEYSCKINASKTKSSVSLHLKGTNGEHVCIPASTSKWLPWCGWLINVETGEFQADYAKYENVVSGMSDKVTAAVNGNDFGKKMRSFLKPKCHALLFDASLNSAWTIRLNVLQIFLIGAMKFHCLVVRLPLKPANNPSFFSQVVEDTCKYGYWVVRDRCAKFGKSSQVKLCEVAYLGMCAFHFILKRKQSRYRSLLPVLRKRISVYENEVKKIEEYAEHGEEGAKGPGDLKRSLPISPKGHMGLRAMQDMIEGVRIYCPFLQRIKY